MAITSEDKYFSKNGISTHQKLIVKVKPSSVRTVGRRLKYFLKTITCYFVFPCIHLSSVLFVPYVLIVTTVFSQVGGSTLVIEPGEGGDPLTVNDQVARILL